MKTHKEATPSDGQTIARSARYVGIDGAPAADDGKGIALVDSGCSAPVAFLKRQAVEQLAEAKRFHDEIDVALDQTMRAALEEIPTLWIPKTLAEERLEDVVRLAGSFLASAKDALDSIHWAHTECDLAFRSEMALDREERRREKL